MAYLELEGISKSYGKTKVLDGVSLQIERGEALVVFGPSGCGKTVLLRLISGVLDPDDGDIRIDGQSVVDVGPEHRGVAMAFQNFALYPHLDAFENIASPLRARRFKDEEIKRRVHEIASLLRIDHVLDHTPRELSNGQKQRTSLARSLVHGPAVLMLDDPLRNVDAKLRYEMRLELPRVLKRYESTIIYVTQDYKEAMALGDRVGVLLEGNFHQVDKPTEVYGQPRDVRIANLFGDPPINLFPVRPERSGDGSLRASIGGTSVAMPAGRSDLAGKDCLIGVRPEDVEVHFDAVDQAIRAELDAVTPFNVRTVMLLKTSDETEILSSCPEDNTLETPRGRREVWAKIDMGKALYFDRATGTRL